MGSVNERMAHLGSVLSMCAQYEVMDRLLERHRDLVKLFDCPSHGECIPHAEEQVAKMRTVIEAARESIRREDRLTAEQHRLAKALVVLDGVNWA